MYELGMNGNAAAAALKEAFSFGATTGAPGYGECGRAIRLGDDSPRGGGPVHRRSLPQTEQRPYRTHSKPRAIRARLEGTARAIPHSQPSGAP